MTLVAVHQPTFLPWLGWWDKLVRADILVLLDDVQFPNSGRTWMNRVRVLVNGEPQWVTMPVHRSHDGLRTVRQTLADDRKPWRERIAATLDASYRRAAHFDDVFPVVDEIVRQPTDRIAELNEGGVRRLAAPLGLDTGKLIRQSELDAGGKATDLLISLCKAVGGTAYLTGDGASGYLEATKFTASGLELVEQRFAPPRYPQLIDEYVPGLSVVDALMNCGWHGTSALICSSGKT